jgi:hypothetical protein
VRCSSIEKALVQRVALLIYSVATIEGWARFLLLFPTVQYQRHSTDCIIILLRPSSTYLLQLISFWYSSSIIDPYILTLTDMMDNADTMHLQPSLAAVALNLLSLVHAYDAEQVVVPSQSVSTVGMHPVRLMDSYLSMS